MSDGIVVKDTEKESPASAPSYLIGSGASVFSISGLQFRLWPIVATIGFVGCYKPFSCSALQASYVSGNTR